MFACYMNLARTTPDGISLVSQIGKGIDTYIDHTEVDTKRNDVIIYTNDAALSILVEPNYSFVWMDNISLE